MPLLTSYTAKQEAYFTQGDIVRLHYVHRGSNPKLIWIFLILSIILITPGCKKRCPTSPAEPDAYWNTVTFGETACNFVSNSRSFRGKLFATNRWGTLCFDDMDNYWQQHALGISTGLDYKPLISKDFTVYLRDRNIYITRTEGDASGSIMIWPRDIDPRFEDFYFSHTYYEKELGLMNGKNRFLTWIRGTEDGHYMDYLVFVDLQDAPIIQITNKGYWPASPPQEGANFWNVSFKGMLAMNNNFYIAYDNARTSYHRVIYPDLSFDETQVNRYHSAITLFEYKGKIWAQLANTELVYSSDFQNWEHFAWMEPYLFDIRAIDDYLFVHINDKAWFFSDSENPGSIYQIPTENMETRTITSISKFLDYLVITTTNGIFYKSYEMIMNDKVPNRQISLQE